MIAVNCSTARDDFEKYCDIATKDFETIIVTRKQGENIVMMSEAEYNNLMENLYIRSNKDDYARTIEAVEQLKRGKGTKRELVENE